MAIRFAVDSAADIIPEEAEKMGIAHIPLMVSFGDVVYRDAVNLTHGEFYEKLVESDVLPKTSQINPGEFTEFFRELTTGGDTVIMVTLSAGLSGTYQSACIAAADFPDQVYVVDSGMVSLGQRILVQRGMQLAQQGMAAAKIAEALDEEKKNIKLLAVLDTLEYLKKGGRISATTAFAGTLLAIKPVITVRDGLVELVGKARGSKNSNSLLRKFITDSNGVDFDKPYCVAYSGLTDVYLRKYIEDNADLWQTETHELPVATVGCVIGTHVGPGAIAVAFFEK